MATLYIGLDFFCPGAFVPANPLDGAETYAHEAKAVFAIAQPLITTDPATDPMPPDVYFTLTGPDLANHKIVFLTDKLDPVLLAQVKASAIPVPFPPGTALGALWQTAPAQPAVNIARVIPSVQQTAAGGLSSPLLLPVTDWPLFSEANFALPPVKKYAHIAWLRQERQAEIYNDLMSWATSLAARIIHDHRYHTDPPTTAESDVYAILAPLDGLLGPDSAPVPQTDETIRTFLSAPQRRGGTPRIGLLWERLLQPYPPNDPRPIFPPRVLHDVNSLTQATVEILELGSPKNPPWAVSYHHKIWTDLGVQVAKEKIADPSAENPYARALGRLYAFGERLRWPLGVMNDRAFMIVDPSASRGSTIGWKAFGTNIQSLLGQVFRLDVAIDDDVSQATLSFEVQGVGSGDFASAVGVLLVDASKPRAQIVGVSRDADRPDGFFLYAPKMAEMTAGQTPPGFATPYALPTSLLDAVDPKPRWSSPPDGPTLSIRTPGRSGLRENELYRSELVGPLAKRRLALPARLVQLSNSFNAPSALFELIVPDALHVDEAAEITSRFLQLASGGEIWMTVDTAPKIAAWDVAGQVLNVQTVADRGLVATLVDRPGPNGRLVDLLAQLSVPVPGGQNDPTTHGASVDLVLPATTATNALFNRVLGGLVTNPGDPERPPLCMLQGSFTSRVSACADRLLDRFELAYSPSPIGVPVTQPVDRQFGNFNKVRVAFSSDSPDVTRRAPGNLSGTRWVDFLNYPDAIAPMKTDGYSPTVRPWLAASPPGASARHFGYYLSQIFTQDARTDDKSDDKQRLAAESLRYLNYLTPHVDWRLEGHAEHQYTFRFPLTGKDFRLPLASDIQNPATAANRGADKDVALLSWTFEPTTATITLLFARDYLRQALAIEPGGNPRPAALRVIYEPLSDLMAGIDRGSVELRLECWAFDPDGTGGRMPGMPSAEDSGALTPNMRLVGTHRRAVTSSDPVFASALSVIRTLLAQPLRDFETNVVNLSTGPGDTWLKLAIPLASGWTDLPLPDAVAAGSDVLRLGLDMSRASDDVIPSSFVDPATPSLTPGFGLPVDEDRAKSYPELKAEDFAALHDAAVDELGRYVSVAKPTALRRRFEWIRESKPALAPRPASVATGKADPEEITDPRRFERLFGEITPFLIAPRGVRPAVDRVLDVYYVPFGFLPLRPHPKIGDSETTLEFAEFLAQFLDDICSGREPQGVKVAPLAANDAYAVRAALRNGLLPDVASKMAELVQWVHHVRGNQPAGTLFTHVHSLAGRALGAMRETVRDMFVETPGLFSTAKGFGLLLFEPDAWSSRLHSLQLRTRIHPAERKDIMEAPSRFDVHQTVFPRFREDGGVRYSVDVLDDKRYDNEFEIYQSDYVPDRPIWTPGSAGVDLARHKRRALGDLQARTGEDVIEQNCRFDDDPTGRRQIEADVVHWNENWSVSTTGKKRDFYLLPSRRRPATPVKLKPRPGSEAARCILPIKFAGPGDHPNLDGLLAEILEDRLKTNNSVEFGAQGSALSAIRRTTALYGLIQPPKGALAAPGWWHIESYASEHYFVIEGDEEDLGPEPFANDRFRIEVDLGEEPFADEDPVSPSTIKVDGALGAWFNYQRLKAADQTGTIAVEPAKVARQELELELRAWLAPPLPEDGLLVAAPAVSLAAVKAAAPTVLETKVSIFAPGKALKSRISSVGAQGMGSVLAAEIMQLKTDKPSPLRFVLKVMVLDEPWRYTRVRVRTERNLRDVNDDGLPDINPEFQMFGNFSNWSSHGRESVELDFRELQVNMLPASLLAIRPKPTLADFLNTSGPFDYGDQVGAILDTSFTAYQGTTEWFWNRDRARAKRYGVSGMIVQRRPDLHPRHARTELAEQLEARVEDIPRLHLASFVSDPADTSQRDFGTLLSGISKADVPSPHHVIRVVWANPGGGTVLSCTWPVRFDA